MANPATSTAYRLPDGRMAVNVTENKTLDADQVGFVQNVTVDAVVFTLPSVGPGLNYTIRNAGDAATGTPAGAAADGSALVTISPAAADKIQGGVSGTATANKDLINTKATSRVGDEVVLVGGATTAWSVVGIKGVWAREA